MTEIIDIYDANLRPLGTMDRVKAHDTGQWHRTFHCWLVDVSRGKILFQTRSQTTKTHPGKLDITAAGHLAAGESVEEGVREVEEELGIAVNFTELVSAGQRVEVSDSPSGVHNREYQSVFFLKTHLDLGEFRPDPGEVAGLAALPIQDALNLFAERADSIVIDTLSVRPDGEWTRGERVVRLDEFIPRIQHYYLAATICAERICEGKRELAIS